MNGAPGIVAADRYFDGHFPGRPILPGVAALALACDALGAGPLRAIAHARFRSPIAPGERLALDARPGEDGTIRVALARDGATVITATLAFGAPVPAAIPETLAVGAPTSAAGTAATVAAPPPPAAPPLDALLPHRPPMRFVTAVLAMHAAGADCLAAIPSGCALVRAGHAPALAAIEAAAQTAAVWEALRRQESGGEGGPRMGYLVSLRDVSLHRRDVPADENLVARVRLEALALPLTHYCVEVALREELVLRGTLATVLA